MAEAPETQNAAQAKESGSLQSAVDALVMPAECADLIRFLCGLWYDIDKLRYEAAALPEEEIKDFLIMKWPVVQGTRNQINLMNIGKQPYKSENVAKAVAWMLKV